MPLCKKQKETQALKKLGSNKVQIKIFTLTGKIIELAKWGCVTKNTGSIWDGPEGAQSLWGNF